MIRLVVLLANRYGLNGSPMKCDQQRNVMQEPGTHSISNSLHRTKVISSNVSISDTIQHCRNILSCMAQATMR